MVDTKRRQSQVASALEIKNGKKSTSQHMESIAVGRGKLVQDLRELLVYHCGYYKENLTNLNEKEHTFDWIGMRHIDASKALSGVNIRSKDCESECRASKALLRDRPDSNKAPRAHPAT